MLLHVGLAPALDAFDEDHPAQPRGLSRARRERHRRERLRDRGGRSRIALEQLDVARAAPLSLRQRAQAGPALGDRAVIVAVNQIGGLQLGHG